MSPCPRRVRMSLARRAAAAVLALLLWAAPLSRPAARAADPGPAALAETARDAAPHELAAQVLARYRGLHSLGFDFTQETRTGPGRVREGGGSGVLYRRGDGSCIVRWEYDPPSGQVLVNDGRELRIYMPREHQLIVSPVDAMEGDLLYGLFTGTRDVDETFTVSPPTLDPGRKGLPPGLRGLRLTPRNPQGQVRAAHVYVDEEYLIRVLIVQDYFDTTTELWFGNLQVDSLPRDDAATVERLLSIGISPDTEIMRH